MAFGGALPETIPVLSANSVSRNTFARANAAAADVGSLCAFLVSARRNISRQETHQCRPSEQGRVAVQPVARRLIATGNGIDEVKRCIPADEVARDKPM